MKRSARIVAQRPHSAAARISQAWPAWALPGNTTARRVVGVGRPDASPHGDPAERATRAIVSLAGLLDRRGRAGADRTARDGQRHPQPDDETPCAR